VVDWTGILIGATGSLLAVAILWALRTGYVPFMSLFSSDTPISGTWTSQYAEGGVTYTETIKVKHIGRRVHATATVVSTAGGPAEVQKIRGTYKNVILTAEYWSIDKGTMERGTFTLHRVTSDELEGHYIFFSGHPLSVRHRPYVWTKVRKS